METWSLFTSSDIVVAGVGMLGLLSVAIVLSTAFRKVDKRERNIR